MPFYLRAAGGLRKSRALFRGMTGFTSTVPPPHRDTLYVTSESDPATGAVISPLYLSTTYERDSRGELVAGHEYSRLSNPTRSHFEEAFTRLELGGGESLAFSSGMQAATSILMACPGAHVILPDDLYHGVYLIIADVLMHWGMTMEKVDFTNHDAVKSVLQEHTSSQRSLVVWMETPSNPQCKVTDIQSVSAMARALFPNPQQLSIVVDSTWSTPYLLNPLLLGADFVMHSITKYIGGHSDVLGGIVTASKDAVQRADEGSKRYGTEGSLIPDVLTSLRSIHKVGGGVCGPLEAWMATRGLRTLPVRLNHQCTSALKIAEALERNPCVRRVFYPGLMSHPQHELATTQMGGRYGGMLSLLVNSHRGDGGAEALQVTRNVRLLKAATSLGGVESLIEHRRSVEGAHPVSPPSLLRISVGLENTEDLLNDLTHAIDNAVNS